MQWHLGAWIVGTLLFAGGCFYDVTVGRCDKDRASGGDACGAGGSGGSSPGSGDSSSGSGNSPSESEGGHDSVVLTKHAACSSALPTVLPDVPSVDVTPTGRPGFDLWRDLGCGMTDALSLCDSTTSCPSSGECLLFGPQGICTGLAGSGAGCGAAVIGSEDGKCYGCARFEQHASACCLGLQGFDCRAWPYPSDGKPGIVCARHEDCEPGLLCGAGEGEGFGICQCPDAASEPPSPDFTCSRFDQ
jgi:hypothetical protein